MPNLQVIMQSIVAVTNALVTNAPQIQTLDFQNPTMNGTTVFFDPYLQATTSGTVVTLPLLPSGKVYGLFVQNLSATNNLQIIYTPFGLGIASFQVGPNGVFVIFDPSESGSGFSNLTVQGIGGAVSAMVLVAA
jgi:hypothetical protein